MTASLHKPTRIVVLALHQLENSPDLGDTFLLEISNDGGQIEVFYEDMDALLAALQQGLNQCKRLLENDEHRSASLLQAEGERMAI